MEKLKKIIIVCIILLIIIILALFILNIFKSDTPLGEITRKEIGDEEETVLYVSNQMEPVSSYIDYMTAVRYINNYLNIVGRKNSENEYEENGFVTDEKEIKQNIYDLLSESYKNKNNITVDNVSNYVIDIKDNLFFIPIEIGKYRTINVSKYVVHGVLENVLDYKYVSDIYLIVSFDNTTGAYSVEPINEKYETINDIKVKEIEENIAKNENNGYTYVKVTDSDIVKELFNNYKKLALGYPEKAYEVLDEEYKKARFGTLENFKKYIEDNKERMKSRNVQKYSIQTKNNVKQYICTDESNNYYVFEEKEILNYTLVLDTYTIDFPEFIEQYNQANENKKVLFNIQKIFEAINLGDYKYVYEKLDSTFKNNYFKSEAELEKYIKENWFINNKVSYSRYQKTENVYVYNIQLEDGTGKKTEKINLKIIMQLKEGTDFVMSFSME